MTSPNRSFVSPLNFSLAINRLPNVTFDIQTANIPGLKLGVANMPTPFVSIPYPGDHLQFSDFMIKFKVQEDFANWYEIFKWMTGLGFPKSFKEYFNVQKGIDKNLQGLNIVPSKMVDTNRKIGNIFSQMTLTVLTSHYQPFIAIEFEDAFPVELTPIEFRTTDSDVDYITCSAYFKYTSYKAKLP